MGSKNEINFKDEVFKRKDSLLTDLKGLLRIESIKDIETASPSWPMGEKVGEALDWMLELSEKDGFGTGQLNGYVGWVDLGKGEDSIVALGHLDVVPTPGRWSHPPFDPIIRDGKLYARGSIDDKGPTMAAYYAMKIIKELKLPLKRKLRLIVGTDEESGMRCMKKYVETFGQPNYGFSPDATFPIIFAEKGQINARIVQNLSTIEDTNLPIRLVSFHAGERGNMVPDTSKAKLAILEKDKRKEIIQDYETYCSEFEITGQVEEINEELTFITYGKAVHGKDPFNGVNAALKLAHFLDKYSLDHRGNKFISFIEELLYEDFYGKGLGIDVYHDEMGPLTVNAGIFRYKPGESALINLNIRCPIQTNYLRTIEIIDDTSKLYGMKLEEVRKKDPHYVDRNHPIIKVMQQAYQIETHQEPTLLTTGGATYARFIKKGVAFGAVFPDKEMSAHQINEYIEVNDLLKATAIYARALYELANY